MRSLAIIICLLLAITAQAQTNELGAVKILTTSAVDQAIVIKNSDGALQLLKIGDTLNADIRLLRVESDHVILEGPGEWSPIRYIVELSGGEMHITRLERRPLQKSILRRGGVVAE